MVEWSDRSHSLSKFVKLHLKDKDSVVLSDKNSLAQFQILCLMNAANNREVLEEKLL